VERNGTIAIADTLCGHYVKQKPTTSYTQNATDSVYPKRTSIPGVSNPTYNWQEDPHIWRSGGTYHVIYSGSGDRVGWHVYSPDGLSWKDNGYAWSPRDYQKIFCYEGSTTCTAWYKMERPSVVLEDGHPTHITWAVSDVDKDNQIPAGSNHGSRILVVPFDGVAFDTDFGTGGGDAGAGGATGTGGTTGAGGGSGRGGADGGVDGGPAGGAGGKASGTGGATGAGGVTAAGGATSSNGGATSNSGAGGTSSGSTGGISGSGGHANGGATSGSSAGGRGGSSASSGTGSSSSGCACTIQGHGRPSGLGSLLVLGLIVLPLFLRRRSTKTN
jgi:hypothetical protein